MALMTHQKIQAGDWVLYAPKDDTTGQRHAGEVVEVRGNMILVRVAGTIENRLVMYEDAELICRADDRKVR